MSTNNIVNGVRIDTINNINYLKLIHDKLYVGLLSRNDVAWGNAVLIGIECPDDPSDVDSFITTNENLDLSAEEYYIKLFNEGGHDPSDTDSDFYGTHFWRILRINRKWILVENTSYVLTEDPSEWTKEESDKYLTFKDSRNISDDNYIVDIFDLSDTSIDPVRINDDAGTYIVVPIRKKNSDIEFYNANKLVYLSGSGGFNVDGFEDLVLLENSKDSSTIKVLNVSDSTLSKISSGELTLTGRKFDIVDSNSDGILIKNLTYDTIITTNDGIFLKFIYTTQQGDKVVLLTNSTYEITYQIYPDYSVDLLTEVINENYPPGIDSSYSVDNFIYESLFLIDDSIENGMNDIRFIATLGNITDINFASLANSQNRLIDSNNAQYVDDSVYVALAYSEANWNKIKEYNLNKLLINWTLTIPNGITDPDPSDSSENDLFYNSDPSEEQLKIFNGSSWVDIDNTVRQIGIFYINDDDPSDIFIDLIYLTNINKISITQDINAQLII